MLCSDRKASYACAGSFSRLEQLKVGNQSRIRGARFITKLFGCQLESIFELSNWRDLVWTWNLDACVADQPGWPTEPETSPADGRWRHTSGDYDARCYSKTEALRFGSLHSQIQVLLCKHQCLCGCVWMCQRWRRMWAQFDLSALRLQQCRYKQVCFSKSRNFKSRRQFQVYTMSGHSKIVSSRDSVLMIMLSICVYKMCFLCNDFI